MAYEAAAAVALRDQQQSQVRSGEDNGGARGRRQLPVEEEKAVVMRLLGSRAQENPLENLENAAPHLHSLLLHLLPLLVASGAALGFSLTQMVSHSNDRG
nr:unnamed protein product [Digitaria exilis]